MAVRPANTQISLGIRPVWSESSLFAWRKLGYLANHCGHSEDSDQTRRMPRLIWVSVAGRTLICLVLSCRGSNINRRFQSNVLNSLELHLQDNKQPYFHLSTNELDWQFNLTNAKTIHKFKWKNADLFTGFNSNGLEVCSDIDIKFLRQTEVSLWTVSGASFFLGHYYI